MNVFTFSKNVRVSLLFLHVFDVIGHELDSKDMARSQWEISPPYDLDESRCTYRSLHAEQKSPWPRSRRTHPLTYRDHRRSHYRGMGRTLMGKLPPCDFDETRHTDRSLHADQKSPWPQCRRTHPLTYRGQFHQNLR